MADDDKRSSQPEGSGDSLVQPARFWSADLHVHTPASKDVISARYGGTSAQDIVQAALAAELDVIAVTDHNTVAWCEDVATAAAGTALTVLPGVEISTTEGHLLGIWEAGTDPEVIREVLSAVGIPRNQQGQVEVSGTKGLADAAIEVDRAGGIAIAAHIDRRRGLLELQVADHVKRTLLTPELAALEIVDPDTQLEVEHKLGTSRVCAFVQSSDVMAAGGDTHELRAIGRRRTWIKASCPDLVGLRHALKDPLLRLRITEPSPQEHVWVKSVKVSGGFLDGQRFDFSPDLNCLLGGTGAGKSLVIELIRFVLGDQTDRVNFPKVREEVDLRLAAALGTDASVEVALVRGSDELIVRRTYDENGSPPPEVLTEHENAVWTERSQVRAFSQGEVIEYAREPVGRLALVDASLDLEAVEAEISDLVQSLDQCGEELCQVDRVISEAEADLAELTDVKKHVGELSALFNADVVKAQEAWTREAVLMKGLATRVGPAEMLLATVTEFDDPVAVPENVDLYSEAKEAVASYRQTVAASIAAVTKARAETVARLDRVSKRWEERYEQFELALNAELSKVESGGRNLTALRKRLQDLQSEQHRLEGVNSALVNTHRPKREGLLTQRLELLAGLDAARTRRRAMRQQRVDSLNKSMSGTVKISLQKEVDDREFGTQLHALAQGSRLTQEHLKLLQTKASPARLVTSFLEGDVEGVANATGVPEHRVSAFFETARDRRLDELMRLQTVEIPDGLRVRFRKPETGAYTDIERLAHGQKCTAILIIALAEGTEPLIIDQPEDALHAPWIEEHLVRPLRDLRGLRQYIFATRSPGLVVSADAEMIIALKSDADRGQLEASGSLERHDLNKMTLYHLEGGAEPFKRRTDKLSVSLRESPQR